MDVYEKFLQEKLKGISIWRRTMLSVLRSKIPFVNLLDNNIVFHTAIVLSVVLIIISIFFTIKGLTLFSFHPLFMTLGTFLFLAEGIVAYRNNTLLETFSPIMQHNKKTKSRAIHQAVQTIGSIFLLLGLLIILAEKIEEGHSLLPSSIHAVVAMITILLISAQVILGQQKLDQMSYNQKALKWHGDHGLLLWDLLCICMFTGLLRFLEFGFLSFLLLFVPPFIWLTVIVQYYGPAGSETTRSSKDEYDTTTIPTVSSAGNLHALENDGFEDDGRVNDDDNVDEESNFVSRKDDNNF